MEKVNKIGICITIPKYIKWEDYKKELDAVADFSQEMNFKVPFLPKNVNVGDRCYLCYNNYIIGWMVISSIGKKSFNCTTTGQDWDGNFISRSGPFHMLKTAIPCKGFRGFKYVEYSLDLNENISNRNLMESIVNKFGYQFFYREPFLISEGLIKSYDIETVGENFARRFNLEYFSHSISQKDLKIFDTNINGAVIIDEDALLIVLPKNNNIEYDKFISDEKLNKYGYFLSSMFGFSDKPNWMILQYEKKFNIDVTKTIFEKFKNLYHLTPKKYINNIMKNGLKPRYIERNDFKNPDRLYLMCAYPNNIYDFAEEQNQTKNDKPNEFYLLKIDLSKITNNPTFYLDDRINNSVYTTDSISPYAISIEKEIKIQ